MSILRKLTEHAPRDALAWDALLSGLDESFRFDELAQELARLPTSLAADARFERYRGSVAQSKQKWSEAAAAYRRALTAEPSDAQVLHRLCQALRVGGCVDEANALEPRRRALETARHRASSLYEEANAVSTLGTKPHTDLYHRLASLREQMGRRDEAVEWHKLVLEHEPDEPVSRSALERLAPH